MRTGGVRSDYSDVQWREKEQRDEERTREETLVRSSARREVREMGKWNERQAIISTKGQNPQTRRMYLGIDREWADAMDGTRGTAKTNCERGRETIINMKDDEQMPTMNMNNG